MKKAVVAIALFSLCCLAGCGNAKLKESQKLGYFDEMQWTSTKDDVDNYLEDDAKYDTGVYMVEYEKIPNFPNHSGTISYLFSDSDNLLDSVSISFDYLENEDEAAALLKECDDYLTKLYGRSTNVSASDLSYSKTWTTDESIIDLIQMSGSVSIHFGSPQYVQSLKDSVAQQVSNMIID